MYVYVCVYMCMYVFMFICVYVIKKSYEKSSQYIDNNRFNLKSKEIKHWSFYVGWKFQFRENLELSIKKFCKSERVILRIYWKKTNQQANMKVNFEHL